MSLNSLRVKRDFSATSATQHENHAPSLSSQAFDCDEGNVENNGHHHVLKSSSSTINLGNLGNVPSLRVRFRMVTRKSSQHHFKAKITSSSSVSSVATVGVPTISCSSGGVIDLPITHSSHTNVAATGGQDEAVTRSHQNFQLIPSPPATMSGRSSKLNRLSMSQQHIEQLEYREMDESTSYFYEKNQQNCHMNNYYFYCSDKMLQNGGADGTEATAVKEQQIKEEKAAASINESYRRHHQQHYDQHLQNLRNKRYSMCLQHRNAPGPNGALSPRDDCAPPPPSRPYMSADHGYIPPPSFKSTSVPAPLANHNGNHSNTYVTAMAPATAPTNLTTTKTFRLTDDHNSNIKFDITLKPSFSIRNNRIESSDSAKCTPTSSTATITTSTNHPISMTAHGQLITDASSSFVNGNGLAVNNGICNRSSSCHGGYYFVPANGGGGNVNTNLDENAASLKPSVTTTTTTTVTRNDQRPPSHDSAAQKKRIHETFNRFTTSANNVGIKICVQASSQSVERTQSNAAKSTPPAPMYNVVPVSSNLTDLESLKKERRTALPACDYYKNFLDTRSGNGHPPVLPPVQSGFTDESVNSSEFNGHLKKDYTTFSAIESDRVSTPFTFIETCSTKRHVSHSPIPKNRQENKARTLSHYFIFPSLFLPISSTPFPKN